MPVYFFDAPAVGLIKIGHTANVLRRFDCMRVQSPVPLILLGWNDGGERDEFALHAKFVDLRCHGEWFTDSPEIRAAIVHRESSAALRQRTRPRQHSALGRYLDNHSTRLHVFAGLVGTSVPQISRIARGRSRPSAELAEKIESATAGKVSFRSLMLASREAAA